MKYAIGGLTRFSEDPTTFSTLDYQAEEKNMILAYMQKFGELCGVGGYVDDLRTGSSAHITNAFYQDKAGYTWSTQDMYHIKKYNAAINEDFFYHVKSKMKQIQDTMKEAGIV